MTLYPHNGSSDSSHAVEILVAEDDDGHARLIQRNLKRAGIANPIRRFADGQEALDFLFDEGEGDGRTPGRAYLLLLDIRMPRVDGVEVLRRIKSHEQLRKMPVLMLTTTDDPREIENCHSIGCSNYITKPVEYDRFIDVVRQLGLFLSVIRVPELQA